MAHTDHTEKEMNCGIYYNAQDPSVCVCARDKAQCGKMNCAPNLATTTGRFLCFLYAGSILALIVVGTLLGDRGKGDNDDDGRKLFEIELFWPDHRL